MHSINIKSSLTVVENVVLNEELDIYRYLLIVIQKQIKFCLLKYDRGEIDNMGDDNGLDDNDTGASNKSRLGEKVQDGKNNKCSEMLSTMEVMSSLKQNITPKSWDACFKAKYPLEWI